MEEAFTKDSICSAAEEVGGAVNRASRLDLANRQTIICSNGVPRGSYERK